MTVIEKERRYWARIAKANGWFAQPFCVIVWLDESGNVADSVSYEGLDRDLIMHA